MKKALAFVLCAVMCVAFLAACGGGGSSTPASTPASGSASTGGASTPAADKGTITFGVLAPLTGDNKEYGEGFKVATQMAVDDINAAGGVNGYKLELVVKDSKGDAKESSDLARQFADDENVLAIIGDFTSGACMANAPIVDEAGIVQLSPTASNPDYAAMSEYCFGIMGRQDIEAPYFAKIIMAKYLGVKKIGVIRVDSDWGQSSFDNFEKGAADAGLEIVAEEKYPAENVDFSTIITKVKASDPEVVLILDQGAVPKIINQIRGANWDIQVTSLGPGTSGQLLEQAGENAEGLIVTSPFFFDESDTELMAWKDRFTETAGFEPTIHPVCAYDCVGLLAKAIEMSGDGEVTRQTIRDNLAAVEGYVGVSGPINFNPDGDINRAYMICGVEDGKWVVLEGFDYGA